MLGDFITRLLVLNLGYAYPAYECFKTLEKNRVQIEELRYWCQYWILVAFLTVFERIADIFISWLPMYGELKLTIFIYLWYPKTKGCGYIYETFMRPYMAKHEPFVDRKIQELRARAWDFALYYWQNCTEVGQAKFFEVLQYVAGQSSRFKNAGDQVEKQADEKNSARAIPTPPPVVLKSQAAGKGKSWPAAATVNRSVAESPKSKIVQSENDLGDDSVPDSPLQQARLKLRRSKPSN